MSFWDTKYEIAHSCNRTSCMCAFYITGRSPEGAPFGLPGGLSARGHKEGGRPVLSFRDTRVQQHLRGELVGACEWDSSAPAHAPLAGVPGGESGVVPYACSMCVSDARATPMYTCGRRSHLQHPQSASAATRPTWPWRGSGPPLPRGRSSVRQAWNGHAALVLPEFALRRPAPWAFSCTRQARTQLLYVPHLGTSSVGARNRKLRLLNLNRPTYS